MIGAQQRGLQSTATAPAGTVGVKPPPSDEDAEEERYHRDRDSDEVEPKKRLKTLESTCLCLKDCLGRSCQMYLKEIEGSRFSLLKKR